MARSPSRGAAPGIAPATVLEVRDLQVRFATPAGPVEAVRGIGFNLSAGEVLGIVGESGSGKSQAALALLGLLADNGSATGSVRLKGEELLGQPRRVLERVRGARVAMVFQDPMTALNPYLTIGTQMGLVLRRHRGLRGPEARRECRDLLAAVQVTDPERRLDQFPHELSGGMRQRVMIATALLCRPEVLIADEPTTALDVTVQSQILALLKELRHQFGTAILFITHDLGIVAGLCDRVLVMKQGLVVESGTVDAVFHQPAHDYTRDLLAAVPRIDGPLPRLPPPGPERVLETTDLAVAYPIGGGWLRPAAVLRAVEGVTLHVAAGETVGIVGESGSGKSSLARAVLRLVAPAGGRVCLLGRDLTVLDDRALRPRRRDMQLVFQDPLAALDPRMTVRDILAEPLDALEPHLSRAGRDERIRAALAEVRLPPESLARYPHQFSGGQCQRIGIARALILRPRLLVCDEAVSALDVTIQAQVTDLLREVQARHGLAILFIAHDLAVVRRLCHRVLVMYLGRVVEQGPAATVLGTPRHPYTRALLAAVPVPDPAIERQRTGTALPGELPSPLSPPSGCRFRTRCAWVIDRCRREEPLLGPGEAPVGCHRAAELPDWRNV